jgi:hypothetical protein
MSVKVVHSNHLESNGGSEVERFISDPCSFFDMSYTKMHSIERGRMEELQLEGLAVRFEQHVNSVPMVAKLAARQKITHLEDFGDVVPLLFEHTMYKSYPLALLERRQFGRLTDWLARLTSVDLSVADVSGCVSIDSWLDVLAAETDLDVSHTSGTSGTMSFFPWSKRDLEAKFRSHRVSDLQVFGEPPTSSALEEPYHYIGSPSRNRRNYMADVMTLGEDDHSHLRATRRPSADLLWLGARLRMAAARGDSSRVEVPESLLARRDELELMQSSARDHDQAWVEEIAALQGERIVWLSFPHDLYSIALPRVEAGERWSFSSGSVVLMMGGTKGHALPSDWMDTVEGFLDARIAQGYGMTELSGLQLMCASGRYHLRPWVIPYVLDPTTSELLPRRGVQTGRFAFVDLLSESHWGGLMTGDEVEVDFDTPCSCGASTQHIGPQIARLSDKRGGDDKITCAATPQAYAEAMEFLTGN